MNCSTSSDRGASGSRGWTAQHPPRLTTAAAVRPGHPRDPDAPHPAQRHNAARVRQMLQLQASPEPGPPLELVLPSLERSGAEPIPPISSRGSVRTVIEGGWSSSVCSRGTHHARPWRHDHQPVHPPSSDLAAACLGTSRRAPVTNATDRPEFAPDAAPNHLESATSDRDSAVVPLRAARLSRGYRPRHPAFG